MSTDLYATAGMAGVPAPHWEPHRVRTAAPVDARRLAARAFYGNPVASWIFGDASRRMRRLERGFELLLRRLHLSHDECYTIDHVVGGALWLPPGNRRAGVLASPPVAPLSVRFGKQMARQCVSSADTPARQPLDASESRRAGLTARSLAGPVRRRPLAARTRG